MEVEETIVDKIESMRLLWFGREWTTRVWQRPGVLSVRCTLDDIQEANGRTRRGGKREAKNRAIRNQLIQEDIK